MDRLDTTEEIAYVQTFCRALADAIGRDPQVVLTNGWARWLTSNAALMQGIVEHNRGSGGREAISALIESSHHLAERHVGRRPEWD